MDPEIYQVPTMFPVLVEELLYNLFSEMGPSYCQLIGKCT